MATMTLNNKRIAITALLISCFMVAAFVCRVYLIDFFYSVRYPKEVDSAKYIISSLMAGNEQSVKDLFLPNSFFLKNKSSIKYSIELLNISQCDSFSIAELQFLEEGKNHVVYIVAQCTSNSSYKFDLKLIKNTDSYLVESISFPTFWRLEGGFPPEI